MSDISREWAGTIADGIPHPYVREAVPDPLDRYDQIVTHLAERFDAYHTTHKRTEGGFELHLAVALETVNAGGVVDVTTDLGDGHTPVRWPPSEDLLRIAPNEGTLAVAAGYGFVCTGIRCTTTTQLPIAATNGTVIDGDRSPMSVPTPGVITTLAFHDVTADGVTEQLRLDGRIPTP
jgi:hypothetical protein